MEKLALDYFKTDLRFRTEQAPHVRHAAARMFIEGKSPRTITRTILRRPCASQSILMFKDHIAGVTSLTRSHLDTPEASQSITAGFLAYVNTLIRRISQTPAITAISLLNSPIQSISSSSHASDEFTSFDRTLIQKAENLYRFDYRHIDVIIPLADTDSARRRLAQIRSELRELTLETL